MRWYIIRTLVHKEMLRHQANGGGMVLAVLLVGMAMLLSFFGSTSSQVAAPGGVQFCFVDYWRHDPWISHLQAHIPRELREQIFFRPIQAVPTTAEGILIYPPSAAAIQVRTVESNENAPRYKVWMWYPGQ